jgi:hypothetical protein
MTVTHPDDLAFYGPTQEAGKKQLPPSARVRIYWGGVGVALICVLCLLGGCNTQVGGTRRPLVRTGPIHGELELVAQQHAEEEGNPGDVREYEATEFEEILRLKSSGDVYHPDFVSYTGSVGIGARQHEYEFDGQNDKGSGTLNEYALSGELLPKKPFPMTFQLDKSEELIPRQFASSLVSEREGANVSLALRSDWPLRFQYGRSEIEQAGQSARDRDLFLRDDERFSFSLDHVFSTLSGLSFNLQQNDTSQTHGGIVTDRQEGIYSFSHYLLAGADQQMRLDTFFDFLDQSGDYDLERLLYQERLRVTHSETLQTHYNVSYHQSERPTLDNSEIRGETGFNHRLYQSLVTTGSIYASEADLDDGVEVARFGGNIGFDYRKKNAWGTLFGHYGFTVLDLEQTGGSALVSVVDERHAFRVAGSMRISLDRPNIDQGSIVVYNSNRSRIYSDYTIYQSSGVTEIRAILGGDIATQGDQTLSIDYTSVTEPQRDEQSFVHSFRARERFGIGISTYFEHQTRNERLDSTNPTIVPDEFEVNLFGIDYIKNGLRLLAEYRDEASTRIPSESEHLEASYLWRLPAQIRLKLYASQRWIDYTTEPQYDIDLFTVGSDVIMPLTDTYSLSANVDYRNEEDSRQGRTKGLQCKLECRYRFRQVSARLGAEFNSLDRLSHEREGVFVYFRLKRMF